MRAGEGLLPVVFIILGGALVLSHAFKLFLIGDWTAGVGINLALLSSMWLFHNRSRRDMNEALSVSRKSLRVASETLQSQRQEITLNTLIGRLERCAAVSRGCWEETVNETIKLASWLNKVGNDPNYEGMNLSGLDYDDRRGNVINIEMKKTERGRIGFFSSLFLRNEYHIYDVVKTLAHGIDTISTLPDESGTETIRRAYWHAAWSTGLISTRVRNFLENFSALSREIEELRQIIKYGLLEGMEIILNEWIEQDPRG